MGMGGVCGWGLDGLNGYKANLSPAKLKLADIGLELSLSTIVYCAISLYILLPRARSSTGSLIHLSNATGILHGSMFLSFIRVSNVIQSAFEIASAMIVYLYTLES